MNLHRLGYATPIDQSAVKAIADHFLYIAKREGKPVGVPAEYDAFQYVHQVPGGMITNLKFMLGQRNMEHRLGEVLEEISVIREGGIMGLTGFPDAPPVRCGAWIGDMLSSLYSVIGILSALVSREKTGMGERIDVAMNDACFSVCTDEAMDFNLSIGIPVRTGNRLSRLAPWNSYQAKDGYVVICVANNSQWHSFLEAVGREDLKEDARFKDQQGRHKYSNDVELIIGEWIKDLTKDEVVKRMTQKKVPCEAIAEFDEVLKIPQLEYREMIQEVVHPFSGKTGLKAAGFPIKFSRLKTDPLAPAPYPGQNSEDVYREILDLPQERIDALKKQGVI